MAEAGRYLWRLLSPPPCSGRVTWSRLPRTMSIWIFNISKEGDAITSLGNLHWCSTSQNGLAISAEEAKRNVVGFFPICKILDSFSFDYLSSPTPWNRTCNLANKALMTRINPAVSVKILSERENQVRRSCLSLSVLHEKIHSIWKKNWFHSDS